MSCSLNSTSLRSAFRSADVAARAIPDRSARVIADSAGICAVAPASVPSEVSDREQTVFGCSS